MKQGSGGFRSLQQDAITNDWDWLCPKKQNGWDLF